MVIPDKTKSTIMKLYYGGYKSNEIIDKTGVSKSTISNVIKKK